MIAIKRTMYPVCGSVRRNRIGQASAAIFAHQCCQQQRMLGTTGRAINPQLWASNRLRPKLLHGCNGRIDRHGHDIAGMPRIAADAIRHRVSQKAADSQGERKRVRPAGMAAFAPVKQQQGRERPLPSRAVRRAQSRQMPPDRQEDFSVWQTASD